VGGQAGFAGYLDAWPGLEHVTGIGDDAVLDVGNTLYAVKGEAWFEIQYVAIFDPDPQAVLIELGHAMADGLP